MIVRIQPPYPAGTGRPLTTYILAVKREHNDGQIGVYVPDPDKDKAEWGRTVNLGTNDPVRAIDLIEVYNASNLRKHSKSRFEHIIVSFPNGERPTDQQIRYIEDRLMAAIGWAAHPRISALHHDTDNWHHHIAVTRIDPVTFKAEHPSFTKQRFQLEAARLELELGLTHERKHLLRRERIEIDLRVAMARTHESQEQRSESMADDAQTSQFPLTREKADELSTPDLIKAVQAEIRFNLAAERDAGERPGDALYDRYKAERESAFAERKAAEQEVYDRFGVYQQQLRGFYAVRHEQQKLEVQRGSERHREHQVLKAEQGRDRVEAHRTRSQELAKARAAHPVLSWGDWLEREAAHGNREAAQTLQHRHAREMQQGLER